MFKQKEQGPTAVLEPWEGERFEYMTKILGHKDAETILNELGAQGWHVIVTVTNASMGGTGGGWPVTAILERRQ